MRKTFFFLILFCYCNFIVTKAQSSDWQRLETKAASLGMEVAPPLENQFKSISTDNDLIDCDLSIKNKKGDLEIRLLVRPASRIPFPHMDAMSMITTLATNEQETVISVLSAADDVLKIDYKADWGLQAFFKPKDSFSNKEHCKLVAIYKEEKAIAYMLFLFDDPKVDFEPFEYILGFD